MSDAYAGQDRGSTSDYDRYLRGMDASMRQKVALTAAHLLAEGRVADMGMGSGAGSHALAALYPELEVVGVDVDPKMVERASATHRLPNLRFIEGDIATPCFRDGSVEAILDSSVLHHVTSYGGYDRDAARRALAVQARALAEDGVLILRDFVDPGPGEVWLDLPDDDGDPDDDHPARATSAGLFRRFAREFRFLQPAEARGFDYEVLDAPRDGWRRFRCARTIATEFVLRKDYRRSWDVEVKEEYTYATQREMEDWCASLGLRVLASTPLRNPWIVSHRFEGRFVMSTLDGTPLDWPATNYVVVGQRVAAGHGVRIECAERVEPHGYLTRACYRRDDGQRFDLVRRPGLAVDVVPWFEQDGRVQVMARRSYPRPVLALSPRGAVDGARAPTYVSEPLVAVRHDAPLGQAVEELFEVFDDLDAADIQRFETGGRYFPSPGGLQEEVRSVLVEVPPRAVHHPLPRASGFSTSGVLRSIDAQQLLRAAQVGGLPDARLELNTYDLLLRRGQGPGDWIGETVEADALLAPPGVPTDVEPLLARAPRRRFVRDHEGDAGFLRLSAARFVERDAEGHAVAEEVREWVEPGPLGLATVATALLARDGDEVFFGLDDDDLPAAQCFDGHSHLLVTPAWRLPREAFGQRAVDAFVHKRLRAQYGLEVVDRWALGGRYHPSAGVTPEVVHPFAIAVRPTGDGAPLHWVPLRELVERRNALRDGHLRVVALRAAHALGLL